MTTDELLAFVRNHFSSEEVYPDEMHFDTEWEAEEYGTEGLIPIEQAVDFLPPDEYWRNLDDLDEGELYDLIYRSGLTVEPASGSVAWYHEKEKHVGPASTCTNKLCQVP